jgi:hypothetical protein
MMQNTICLWAAYDVPIHFWHFKMQLKFAKEEMMLEKCFQ